VIGTGQSGEVTVDIMVCLKRATIIATLMFDEKYRLAVRKVVGTFVPKSGWHFCHDALMPLRKIADSLHLTPTTVCSETSLRRVSRG
jgi:hypothetical protein